jgi:ketosteroid isomerase-like protein
MRPDLESFLDRFAAFGEKPGVERYLALFHPDATLFDSGMERPITVAEIPASIEGVLRLAPEFRMTPERWRFREPTLFVEAHNRARLGGEPFAWRSVYCIDLRGDRVIRGRRYYDRRPLFARILPATPAAPVFSLVREEGARPSAATLADAQSFVAACTDCWRRGEPHELDRLYRDDGSLAWPGLERPLGRAELPGWYRGIAGAAPDLRLELDTWAGDAALVFLEWKARLTLGGREIQLGIAERFDLAAGGVLAGRAYFDTLPLAEACADA